MITVMYKGEIVTNVTQLCSASHLEDAMGSEQPVPLPSL